MDRRRIDRIRFIPAAVTEVSAEFSGGAEMPSRGVPNRDVPSRDVHSRDVPSRGGVG